MTTIPKLGRWFRFYEAALHEQKVQGLSGDHFKTWVNLLCLAAGNDGVLPAAPDVAFALRPLAEREISKRIAALIERGLIDENDGVLAPHNWSTRQYQSDGSTGRVKRFRSRAVAVSETGSDDQ